jgi:hypothetical protein
MAGKRLWLLALVAVIAVAPTGTPRAVSREAAADSARTPIIVELFTSEGCSSCPPADQFLSKLEAQQPVPGVQIIAIEEHVDYWNQLGWHDPFSSADWTERQRKYADVLGNGNVYTPQMIVNGAAEFVGSRERNGQNAIEQAAKSVAIPLTVTAAALAGKPAAEITVRFGGAGADAVRDSEVWLAITETGLESAVTRGENAGKDLRHAAVLRKLQKLGSAAAKGGSESGIVLTGKVSLDSSWKRENLHAVAFIQERRRMHILGARQVSLSL